MSTLILIFLILKDFTRSLLDCGRTWLWDRDEQSYFYPVKAIITDLLKTNKQRIYKSSSFVFDFISYSLFGCRMLQVCGPPTKIRKVHSTVFVL